MFVEHLSEIQEELVKVNKRIEEIVTFRNDTMNGIMEHVLKKRGKQLRSTLVLLISRLTGKKPDAVEAAAVVEICHTASLIHDDVIDDARERRGQPSVQQKYGKALAVYAGDYMIFAIMRNAKLSKRGIYLDIMGELERMCDGELTQFDNRYRLDVTVDDYLEIIYGKTCSLFEVACVAGANTARMKEEEQAAIRIFARNLGLMFQIRDDLLDYQVRDNRLLDKSIHNDFWNGYFTLPIICGLSDEETRELIDRKLKLPDEMRTEEDFYEITKRLNAIGAFGEGKRMIEGYYQKAMEALEPFHESVYKETLINIITFLKDSVQQIEFVG